MRITLKYLAYFSWLATATTENYNLIMKPFIFDTFQTCFNFMHDPLANYAVFSENLNQRIKVKAGDNEQFSFDVELDNLIKASLIKHGVAGSIFSEESGFFKLAGEPKYRVVYDPFCNSSLATRTFHEGALGMSIFTDDYQFLAAAILDYQTGIIAFAEANTTHFYQIQTGAALALRPSATATVKDAWAVLTLEDKKERAHLKQATTLLNDLHRVAISSGHIYWLKLAAGFIDIYADPFGGEALYEMFACTVAQKAGCIVTDREGVVFDASGHLKIFEADTNFRYYPVAASNRTLHAAVLAALQ